MGFGMLIVYLLAHFCLCVFICVFGLLILDSTKGNSFSIERTVKGISYVTFLLVELFMSLAGRNSAGFVDVVDSLSQLSLK